MRTLFGFLMAMRLWLIIDKRRGLYRVSLFEDGHYVDEVVFREYQGNDA